MTEGTTNDKRWGNDKQQMMGERQTTGDDDDAPPALASRATAREAGHG
jgi:hypothetical protein